MLRVQYYWNISSNNLSDVWDFQKNIHRYSKIFYRFFSKEFWRILVGIVLGIYQDFNQEFHRGDFWAFFSETHWKDFLVFFKILQDSSFIFIRELFLGYSILTRTKLLKKKCLQLFHQKLLSDYFSFFLITDLNIIAFLALLLASNTSSIRI